MPNNPNIAFFGTPDFALPILKALLKISPPILVISAPDDSQKSLSPIAQCARKKGIRTLAPQKMTENIFEGNSFDIFIIAAYGKILPKHILEIPRLGTLNVHPSLLPKYRGASPIQASIVHGDTRTGVTIISADEKVDHGPILAQRTAPISRDDDGLSLSKKLANLGRDLLLEILPKCLASSLEPKEQDHENATFTKLLKKDDGKINWTMSVEEIHRHIRAYRVWPTSWTTWEGIRIKILKAEIDGVSRLAPGTFVKLPNKKLGVATQDRLLLIEELQIEGKKPISASAFLNGYGRKLLSL